MARNPYAEPSGLDWPQWSRILLVAGVVFCACVAQVVTTPDVGDKLKTVPVLVISGVVLVLLVCWAVRRRSKERRSR